MEPQRPLEEVPTRQLRAWIRKARERGMGLRPPGYGRDFSVAQLSAELALRPDRDSYVPGHYGRRELRKVQVKKARSNYRGRKDR